MQNAGLMNSQSAIEISGESNLRYVMIETFNGWGNEEELSAVVEEM